jgi:SAM-dependent methyltransferase
MVRRWDRFRDAWDREYAMRGTLWRGRADLEPWLDDLPQKGRVLELGCGDGKFLRALQDAGHDTLGVDRSVYALRRARDAGCQRLVRADVRWPPFRTRSFGAVAVRYVLGALAAVDRFRAARSSWELVAPGGVLLFEEFTTDDFRADQGRPVELGTRERNRGILAHYWTRDEVEGLLEQAPRRLEEIQWTQRTDRGPSPRAAVRAVWRRSRS